MGGEGGGGGSQGALPLYETLREKFISYIFYNGC